MTSTQATATFIHMARNCTHRLVWTAKSSGRAPSTSLSSPVSCAPPCYDNLASRRSTLAPSTTSLAAQVVSFAYT